MGWVGGGGGGGGVGGWWSSIKEIPSGHTNEPVMSAQMMAKLTMLSSGMLHLLVQMTLFLHHSLMLRKQSWSNSLQIKEDTNNLTRNLHCPSDSRHRSYAWNKEGVTGHSK